LRRYFLPKKTGMTQPKSHPQFSGMKLRTIDGHLFELSEPAVRLSATLQNALDDTAGDAPVPVPLGAASMARVAAMLERTVAVLEGAPEERRAELRKQGLPREVALDDELRAAKEPAVALRSMARRWRRMARVAALLERMVAVVEGAPEERRAELRNQGLPHGASLDDELCAATEAALAVLGVVSLLNAAQLLFELRWFDAPLPTTMLAERVARLLRGQPAVALRELLGVTSDDHLSADEVSAVLAEPLCAPAAETAAPAATPATEAAAADIAPAAEPGASAAASAVPPPTRSVSLAMDGGDPFEGNMMACLERCDASTLRELKAVSAAWQGRARAVLCDAASAWRQKPIWSPSAEGRALAAQLGGGAARYGWPRSQLAHERYDVLQLMRMELDCVVDLPGHALAVVPLLEDSDEHVREAAVQTLGKLDSAALAQHGATLVAKLEDSDVHVRQAAVQTLGKLEPAVLAQHGAALAARLEDSMWVVRNAAVEALGKLDVAALAQHGAALAARLEDSDWCVRQEAVKTLGKLEPAALAQHGTALAARLEDPEVQVREAALWTLRELEPAALAQHGAALVARLEDWDSWVRRAAVQTLGKLDSAALVPHAAALATRLEDSECWSSHAPFLSSLRGGSAAAWRILRPGPAPRR